MWPVAHIDVQAASFLLAAVSLACIAAAIWLNSRGPHDPPADGDKLVIDIEWLNLQLYKEFARGYARGFAKGRRMREAA